MTTETNLNQLLFFGALGFLASIFVGMGEFLVHFSSAPFDADIPYSYFLNIPENRLIIGHFLIVPFIPLYIFGYWHIYLALKAGDKRLAEAVIVLGVFAFVIGGIWVGSRANLGMLVKAKATGEAPELFDNLLTSYGLLLERLVEILRVIVLLISICFVWAILKGGTLYPKWMAFFNPILLLAIVAMLFFNLPSVGRFLMPTGMNVAHFVLFLVSMFALSGSRRT